MLNVLIDYSWNAFDQHQISFGLPRAAQHPSFIQLKIVVWSWYPVWFTVARKLVQMRKGGWMTRQPFMCSRTIRNGRAGSIRKWWWWPHGYPSAAFETPFTGNQPRHRQRVFITHVQHYKAEIEPESYSLVIDLFSIVWRLETLTSLLGIGSVMAVQHDNLVHSVLCLSSVNIL